MLCNDDDEVIDHHRRLLIIKNCQHAITPVVFEKFLRMGSADTASQKVANENGSVDKITNGEILNGEVYDYGPNLKVLPSNNQVKELQTILRDK